jgi:hypothetical protein
MAYTLKSTGLATALALCVGVDEDGTTIKDFVANRTLTPETGHPPSVGATPWKGTSRGYFTTGSGGTFDPWGLAFSPLSLSFGSAGVGVFIALAGAAAATGAAGYSYFVGDTANARGLSRPSGSGAQAWAFSGGAQITGATALPTNGTTKFSTGANFIAAGAMQIYYGLESGALAQDATGTDSNVPGTWAPDYIGGGPGLGVQVANYHIVAIFNRALTLAEMQSLHDDWFGTLFDASGAAQDLDGDAAGGAAATGAASVGKPLAGAATGGGAATGAAAHGVPLAGGATGGGAATGALAHGVPLAGSATGGSVSMALLLGGATITTEPFKNDSGSLLAGTTIEKFAALKVSDLTLAATWSNVTSDGAGVFSLPHPDLLAGTAYLLVSCNADGSARGVHRYTAA